MNAHSACAIAVRVVSLPAVTRRTKKLASSWWVSASPSTSELTSADTRSSTGFATRSAPSDSIIAVSVAPASRTAVTGCTPSGMYSESPPDRIVLEQRSTSGSSERGTPIISQMIRSGKGAATSVTKSNSPCRAAASTVSRATRSIESSMDWTRRGLKALDTMRRSRVWRGLSVEIIPEKYSTISGGRSMSETAPCPGSEDLRMPARGRHVAVRRERVVAVARGERHRRVLDDGVLEVRDGPLRAQELERPLAGLGRQLPEGGGGEVDLVDRERRRGLHDATVARGPARCPGPPARRVPSVPWAPAKGGRSEPHRDRHGRGNRRGGGRGARADLVAPPRRRRPLARHRVPRALLAPADAPGARVLPRRVALRDRRPAAGLGDPRASRRAGPTP